MDGSETESNAEDPESRRKTAVKYKQKAAIESLKRKYQNTLRRGWKKFFRWFLEKYQGQI